MATSTIKAMTATVNQATKSTIVTQGTISYIQIGKIVLVQISDFSCAKNTHGAELASGLPPRNEYMPFCVLNTTATASVGWRVTVTTAGNLVNHYPAPSSITQGYGSFWYIAS